jgi:predicted polyphosphate/ATP-dependent NAD kinase
MNTSEFELLAKNDPVAAMVHLHEQLEAAELNQAVILGGDGTASDVTE